MIGRTVAHYTILDKIGQGGMGEVYLASDTRLKRRVALKVLPQSMARDELQMARLTREAELLASLDHPNIAQIYGIEEVDGNQALVLQLIEGPTLAERISRGAIPLEEALPIAVQIAQALEAAHEKGVIHRDLKPANIKITPDGTVKILDFGLAKSLPQDHEKIAGSPTLTVEATQVGAILGTAGYMSPEQALGRPSDRRADIWSFGCVFYEMLTGAPPFPGGSFHEVVGAVLHQAPDLERLPAEAGRRFDRLFRRCFQKDVHLRWQHIGDVRIELQEVPEPVAIPTENRYSSIGLVVLALLFGLLLGGTGVWTLTSDSGPGEPSTSFVVKAPDWVGSVAISPNGQTLAFRSGNRLYLRRLDELALRPVPASEGEISVVVFSPDSRWLGFVSGDFLYKIGVDGGDPIRITSVGEVPGAAWGPGNQIVFSNSWTSGLRSVPAAGGEVIALTEPDREAGEVGHWWPHFLPDGRILFTIWNRSGSLNHAQIAIFDPASGEIRTIREGVRPKYVRSGHLVFFQAGTYFVAPFDAKSGTLRGTPSPLDLPIRKEEPTGAELLNLAVSENGTLAFVVGQALTPTARLAWVDRSGATTDLNFDAGAFNGLRLAPNGREFVATQSREGEYNLWLCDLGLGTSEQITRLANNFDPIWHPIRRLIALGTSRSGSFDIFAIDLDGDKKPFELFSHELDYTPTDWSPDGKTLLVDHWVEGSADDIWGISFPEAVLRSLSQVDRVGTHDGVFSPDGRAIALRSAKTGRRELYLHILDGSGASRKLSDGGASFPRWTRESNEIFYISGEDRMMVVPVKETRSGLEPGPPQPLFSHAGFVHQAWDVTADGQRFLMARYLGDYPIDEVRVILNWSETLKGPGE